MTTEKVEKAKGIDLEAFDIKNIYNPNRLCTVGILINELKELSEEKADLLQAYLDNSNIRTTNIQHMISKAGFRGRGWHQINNHRKGMCPCVQAGK